MDYIFYTMTAINGFDGVSHYLRAALIVNTCSTYGTVQDPQLPGQLPDSRQRQHGHQHRR